MTTTAPNDGDQTPRPDAAAADLDGGAALRDAAVWRLLGLLCERPRPGWATDVQSVAGELGDRLLEDLARRAVAEATEGRYLALVGPNGLVSPRAAAFNGMTDPARNLADLKAFHAAFAWHPASEDPADHIAVETGFAGYLLLKEAYARATGQPAAAATTAAARATFLAEHLGPFAWRLARRLSAVGDTWLAAAAHAIALRTGVPAPTEDAPAPGPDAAGDAPFECPACG